MGGIVKPMRGKTLEEAAGKYAEDLVLRNMLLSRERDRNGNLESCSVHDLLRGVSIKELEKERFLEVPKRIWLTEKGLTKVCVICNKLRRHMKKVQISEILGLRSSDGEIPVMCNSCARSPFARSQIVVAVKVESQNVPMLTTYRSIDLSIRVIADRMSILHTIRLIWNLEILDIYQGNDDVVFPKELWEMPQLRHVRALPFTIPNPACTEHDVIVLENLQTFVQVQNFAFTEDVVRRIPNLRHLEVRYDVSEDDGVDLACFYLENINRLQKLELLSVECFTVPMDFNAVSLPCSLKILSLEGCEISWDKMSIIGSSLPNLEELILWENSVVGKEWDLTIEGSGGELLLFLRLKYLELRELNLKRWRVDDGATQFPSLETIQLDRMEALEEIPREIGELPSLNSIVVGRCGGRLEDSAEAIVDDQRSNGNEMFVIDVWTLARRYYRLGGANRASS